MAPGVQMGQKSARGQLGWRFQDGAKRWRDKFSPAGNPDGTVVITLWKGRQAHMGLVRALGHGVSDPLRCTGRSHQPASAPREAQTNGPQALAT